MSSLERAKTFHRVLQTAEDKVVEATNNRDIQMMRFKTRLKEAIQDDPQLLKTDGWLRHHAINTLEWKVDRIAAAIGCSREGALMGNFK
jgi:hypothetical protein